MKLIRTAVACTGIFGKFLLLLIATGSCFAQQPLTDTAIKTAEKLRDQALEESDAYRWVESLTVEVGPRLAGSEGDVRAVAWATLSDSSIMRPRSLVGLAPFVCPSLKGLTLISGNL